MATDGIGLVVNVRQEGMDRSQGRISRRYSIEIDGFFGLTRAGAAEPSMKRSASSARNIGLGGEGRSLSRETIADRSRSNSANHLKGL
jgi:hypothetical protein